MRRRIVGPFNVLLDGLLVAAALFLAIVLRFDGRIPDIYLANYLLVAPWLSLASVVALGWAGVHRHIWRYVGVRALVDIGMALTGTSILLGIVNLLLPEQLFPRSVPFISWLLQLVLVGGIRIVGRMIPMGRAHRGAHKPAVGDASRPRRVLIFGAGDVGETLVRDLFRGNRVDWHPVGFVDDAPNKQGRTIHGLRVLGGSLDIPRLIQTHHIDAVIIAAPSAPSALVSSIFRCCQEHGVECKTLPSLAGYVVGKSPLQQLREVRIEDLLGREPVEVDLDEVRSLLRGKSVLVTGAGGSIGSELCRQIAKFEPERLVAFDHDENKLCYIGLEIRGERPELPFHIVVNDVKDRPGVAEVLRKHRPAVIFHAAAHKHVSFMEDNPRAAILNNVVGTLTVAEEAIAHGVRNFVLISTDKAVNPTNVMGASKRLCERVVKALSERSETRFNSVRFGNVLGSAGSVIPIFTRQIAAGGPVTITHPEARRYFMTIPEAAQLVIQAGAFKRSGTVFVLDMGEQVKVLDVAQQLIRLSGYEPERDIAIRFIGLRPGEKLYEELLTDSERTTISVHRKIFIWRSEDEDWDALRPVCEELIACARDGDVDARVLKDRLAELVPEYQVEQPVVALDETPAPEAQVATRSLDDQDALPPELRPTRDPFLVAACRGVGRWVVASAALVGVGGLALAHAFVAPGAPIFVREARVGRNRRARSRRLFSRDVTINRRGTERRRRNLYGQPFRRLRFNVSPREGASRMERGFYAFLRRHALDRLPSAVHVLTGEMAVVGPRAETLERVEETDGSRAYRRRFVARPGLTGLGQVLEATGDNRLAPERRHEIDKFYVGKRSIGMDIRILTRTFGVVMSGTKDEPVRLRDELGVGAAMTTRLDTGRGSEAR
jgi:FlaA1/EpsC-like NDP-sugar epimerase/lipopolysaccharide/colanic/teichoic acid biosynthesis glycosyltransferase